MQSLSPARPKGSPALAWLCTGSIGVAAPVAALLLLAGEGAPAATDTLAGPILAVGLMGVGMIGAAAAGSLRVGVALALLAGAGLLLLGALLGITSLPQPLATALAMCVASISFAVRGALFARSAADKGWWIALFVVAGEVAILATAFALPGALPDWLLALLPAQWASVSIRTSLGGASLLAAGAPLAALAGTAAATHLVARLWPRRWPYLVMFTAWLGFSALVWHYPAPPQAGMAIAPGQAAQPQERP